MTSDPWPYGVGYIEERPCPVCGVYVSWDDEGYHCAGCAERGDA